MLGIALVFVDGSFVGGVDQYAQSVQVQRELFKVEGLPPGRHGYDLAHHGLGETVDIHGREAQHARLDRAHAGQVRKDGRTPYVAHCFRVTMTVRDVFGCTDPVCLCAALLHDTIEDTGVD